jgi:hypothetical protein
MEPEYIGIAAEMLGTKPSDEKFTPYLRERLDQVNDMVQKVGGELRSRQAIAVVVMQWAMEGCK